jgi:hypothetical protein
MNLTPKMPPRPPRTIEDDHYRPERLFRAVAEILLITLLLGVIAWALHS